MKYLELIVKLERPDLRELSQVELLGYGETIREINKQISDSRNFIVHGPGGVGKTTVIRRLAEKSKRNFMYIDACWMTMKQFGDPEVQLGALIKEAIEMAPTILFLDEIDYICEKKRNQSDLERRAFIKLKSQLEYLRSISNNVLVIAATEQPGKLDQKITKYFHKEIRFPIPNRDDRVLKLKRLFPHFKSDEIETLADKTHCYLFDDLTDLRFESLDKNKKLNFDSVLVALGKFKPTTIRNYTSPCAPLKWDDIGGVEDVKRELERTVIKPLKDPKRYGKFCPGRSRGAILYGPPGCSKTMLAQALATESGYNFISIKGPELFSKYVGDSEAAVRRVYREAREIAPCIIFFDEIDGFAVERTDSQGSSVGDKVVTQLLTEFNGDPDGVFTIAATNRPDRVDSALMRPGRLDSAIYIPLPSESDRAEIFRVHMRQLPVNFEHPLKQVTGQFASRTPGYSGAEIAKVCRVAGEYAYNENDTNDAIEWRHFDEAIRNVKPTTRLESLTSYDKFYKRTLDSGQRASLAGDPTRKLCDDLNNCSFGLD